MDILFLSVSTGGGHLKAAEALKEKVLQRYPGARTLLVDTLKYVNPIADKLIVGGYLNTVKKTPQIYGMLYDFTETGENINDLSKTVNRLLSYKIKKLIYEFAPSLIVCTHPFPLQMLSTLKKSGKVNVPTLAILTDYASHPFWLHSHIDAYIVAHDKVKREMIGRGIPEDIIYPFGLPIGEAFLQRKEKSALMAELQLENKTTLLIMGGSLGFGEFEVVFKSLLRSKKDLQLIAITGQNVKLKHQLEKYALSSNKKIKILSYTNRVSDLMDVADFIITKPGGMSITESLVKGLPIIIMSPLPGVEERNADFLMKHGAAVRILDSRQVEPVLNQVMDNPLRVSHMRAMSQCLAKPNSTEDTFRLMERLATKNIYSQSLPH